MKLFKMIDGAYLGFYQERGGTVFISGYRTVVSREWVCELVTERYQEPDFPVLMEKYFPAHYETQEFEVPEKTETKTRVVAGHYDVKQEYIQGHYETQEIWIPEHEEQHFVEVPGFYELRLVRVPGKWVTTEVIKAGYWESYLYTRPADPVTGRIEVSFWDKRWVPERTYSRLVWQPETTMEVNYWVDATYEYQTVIVPGQYRDHRVWVEGEYKDVNYWVKSYIEEYTVTTPAYMEEREVLIPWFTKRFSVMHEGEWVMEEHLVCGFQDVTKEVPVYSYYGADDEYDLIHREYGPVVVIAGPPEGDKLTLRIIESGDEVVVEAKYLGLGTRTNDNEYILPVKPPAETVEAEPLTEAEIEKIKWGD